MTIFKVSRNTKIIAGVAAAAIGGSAISAQAALLVRYTFDEAASGSTNALNTGGSLGSAADGVFQGASTRGSSTPNNATLGGLNLSPNGTGALEGVGPSSDLAGLDTLSTITVTTWLSVRGDRTANESYKTLVSDWGSGNGWVFYYSTVGNDDRKVKLGFQVGQGPGHALETPTVLDDTDGHWIFLAATWDQSTGAVKLYSGTTSTSVTLMSSLTGLTFASVDNTVPMRVGNDTFDSTPDSRMDDVRIYDNVLTLGELETARIENVPEPAGIALSVMGLAGGSLMRRRRRHQ